MITGLKIIYTEQFYLRKLQRIVDFINHLIFFYNFKYVNIFTDDSA